MISKKYLFFGYFYVQVFNKLRKTNSGGDLYMVSVDYYAKLMSISYSEIVKILHTKYDKCKYDHFNEESFKNFLKK